MKRIICLALSLCCAVAFAQEAPKEVSLVVSADGATKTEAVNNALRSAIEQTFGTFVSANTEILNDQMVKDEIATVSSGNIQKYKEIASVTLPNGNTSVTLNVTVSLKKLVKYAQSKGSECEFAGATFGANARLYEFNKKNEQIAFNNMIKQLDALRPAYDFELVVTDPVINKDGTSAKVILKAKAIKNERTEQFLDIINKTLMSLALSEDQVQPLQKNGFKFEKYFAYYGKRYNPYDANNGNYGHYIYLYNSIPNVFCDYVLETFWDFSITDNLGNEFVNTINTVYCKDKGFGHITGAPQYRHMTIETYGKPGFVWMSKNTNVIKEPFIFIFTDKEQWTSCEMAYNVPVEYISQINKITILPSFPDKTNILDMVRKAPSNNPVFQCNYMVKSNNN